MLFIRPSSFSLPTLSPLDTLVVPYLHIMMATFNHASKIKPGSFKNHYTATKTLEIALIYLMKKEVVPGSKESQKRLSVFTIALKWVYKIARIIPEAFKMGFMQQ